MTKENLTNMERCPRFSGCSIPKCPLDILVGERSELKDDEVCVLRKFEGRLRTKRMQGNMTPKMRGLSNFIPKNKK
jgi:hypothetical protein